MNTQNFVRYLVELEGGGRFEVLIDERDPSHVVVHGQDREMLVEGRQDGTVLASADGRSHALRIAFEHGELVVETPDGRRRSAKVVRDTTMAFLHAVERKAQEQPPPAVSGRVLAPIAGNVASLATSDGQPVAAGDPLLVIEAMKMLNTITAPKNGVVRYAVASGQNVQPGALLADVVDAPSA